MKKFLTITALLLAGLATGAKAQRVIDLKTVLVKPEDGTVVNCTDSFAASWMVINVGPDAIYPTDTLGIADYESYFEQSGTTVNKDFFPITLSDTAFAGDTLAIDGLSWMSHNSRIQTLIDTATGEFVNTFVAGRGYLAFSNILGIMKEGPDSWDNDPDVTDPNDTNNYSYRLIVYDCAATGIRDAISGLDKQNISVFPNPAGDNINFKYEFDKASAATARISDITGRTVLLKDFGKNNAGSKSFSIDVSALHAGTYFLEFITEDKRGVSKFTVRK